MGLSFFKSKSDTNKVLVIFAHPSIGKSRVNVKLIKALEGIDGIAIHNLYENYADFKIDKKAEQSLLLDYDTIVWQHPFYWYSTPALLKQWIDVVLEHGFAYGKYGKALKGKLILNAITTGGDRNAYQTNGRNNFTINQLLVPFEQTANLCQMVYLSPFVVHNVYSLNDNDIEDYASKYREAIIALRDNKFSTEEIKNKDYYSDLF